MDDVVAEAGAGNDLCSTTINPDRFASDPFTSADGLVSQLKTNVDLEGASGLAPRKNLAKMI